MCFFVFLSFTAYPPYPKAKDPKGNIFLGFGRTSSFIGNIVFFILISDLILYLFINYSSSSSCSSIFMNFYSFDGRLPTFFKGILF